MKKAKFRMAAVIIAVCVCLTAMCPMFTASAVSYAGSGTVSDPYLVETAEQLQGMRENLSAHYKLSNTIDLSGVDFKPIGRFDNPFTGSFVSDLNQDGTPKFAIKNLTIKVADTPYAAEYKNKWEAALFGYAKGATVSGIYVFDAYIRCEVLGDNEGAIIYGDYKPGMDEMNSAILIGDAQDCTVMNCGSTGKIDTKASGCGGLIGRIHNSTVTNCYSTADVVTKGKWGVGGFAGNANGSNISYCFATGYVESVQGNASGFIETIDENTTISNCYATGDTKSYAVDHHGASPGASFYSADPEEAPAFSISNCFSLGSASAAREFTWTPISNCYSLKGTNGNSNFTVKDAAGIKAAFKGVSGWDISGEYPTITTIGYVKDTSVYQPGVAVGVSSGDNTQSGNAGNNTDTNSQQNQSSTVSSGNTSSQTSSAVTSSGTATSGNATASGNTTTSTTVGGSTTVSTTPITGTSSSSASSSGTSTAASASEVAALIEALPDPEESAITIDDKDAIKEAWFAYDSLGTVEKEDFDSLLYVKISQLRLKISMVIVSDMITAIKELPEDTKDYTDEDIENILSMWEDYGFLDDTVKAEIAQKHIDKLTAAYEYASTQNTETQGGTASSALTTAEIIIVTVSALIILLAVAFYVFAGIVFLKKSKAAKAATDDEIGE